MRAAAPIRCLVVALAAAAAGGGCGSSEFTAEELVAELNRHGAGIELGEPLAGGSADAQVHAVELAEPAAEDGDHAHAGGSLAITDGEDAALAEYRRCEEAASLLCFRAANAVLIFEDSLPPEALVRIGTAIRAIGEQE